MKAITIGCLAALVILSVVRLSAAQAQLSYTNADIAQQLIRSPTTTTPVPTTKKSTFFGGIRNLFSKSSTTPPPSAVADGRIGAAIVGASTTTTAKPATVGVAPPVVTPPPIASTTSTTTSTTTTTTTTARPATTPSSTSTTSTTTTSTTPRAPTVRPKDPLHDFESYATITLTTKRPKTHEDFPSLPAPRRPAAATNLPTAAPTPATTANAWSRPLPGSGQAAAAAGAAAAGGVAAGAAGVSFVTTTRPTGSTSARPSTTTVSPGSEASDVELEALTEVLYTKESSLLPLVTINYQGKTQSSATVDEAPLGLITVNEAALNANPTVAKMKLLYNNYEQDTAINEHVTAMERNEENDFIDTLLASALMRHTMNYLQQKDKVTLDPASHRALLKTIWFSLYSRGKGKIGSSAFEHVFLTELRNGTVSGFHNWIYYYEEELAGRANYQGWLKKTELGTKATIVKYRFSYNGIMKPVNAMFVGTSPELEMALYTLCFAMRADRECPVSLGGQRLKIRTHTFRYRGKNLIGSAFPEI